LGDIDVYDKVVLTRMLQKCARMWTGCNVYVGAHGGLSFNPNEIYSPQMRNEKRDKYLVNLVQ